MRARNKKGRVVMMVVLLGGICGGRYGDGGIVMNEETKMKM